MSSRSNQLIPRLISWLTIRSGYNRTPLESLSKVKIDSYLISIGLLSEHYGVQSSLAQAFWKRIHQILVLWLQWLMVFKWLFCSFFIDNGYTSAAQIGDFTASLKGKAFDYHLLLVMWSLSGATTCYLLSLARNHSQLNLFWLKPFELCKGAVKHSELRLEAREASEFWERVVVTLWLSKLFTRLMFGVLAASYLYVVTHLMPRDQLDLWAIAWIPVTLVWLYYTTAIQIGVMAVFHMLCYYFIAKYRQLNDMINEVEVNPKMDLMTKHQRIDTYMNDHNTFAKELVLYNKFWQYYLVTAFTIYITIVCHFVDLLLFAKMNLLVRALSLVTTFLFTSFLLLIAFSAGDVSDKMHQTYRVLNAVSQNNMPLVLKTQLQIYIQRVGGPTMGFSCWNLFSLTYDGFSQAVLMVGSFFLLFMDVTRLERTKRKSLDVGPQMAVSSLST